MDIRPIKTEQDYNNSIMRIEELWGAKRDTAQGDELELLITLVESYEMKHYPIAPPDPVDAIKFRMEQMNMDNKELAKVIGYKSRVSEIFNRKRKLNLKMIRNLHDKMKIPYESLFADYK